MISKKFLSGVALTALSMGFGVNTANAQSTGSQIQEEETVVVTGSRASAEGAMIAETVAKARSTITDEYITTQVPGQTILESINLIPGVSFTNADAYGGSGGAINMRGFDGARISLTVDGIPLNDTGNYAIYSSQQMDPELIQRAAVNLGTTDVDSPTASAVGGTINYVTRTPSEEMGAITTISGGDDQFFRVFGLVETGALGPWDTRFWASASSTTYDHFVGPGQIQKRQYNGGVYQPLGGQNFIRFSGHFNEARNNFYYRLSQAQYAANPDDTGYTAACNLGQGPNGFANSAGGTDCSTSNARSYINFNLNPSNTANIRGASRFDITDSLTLTVDPSFQFVRANGGGTTTMSETSPQLRGGTSVAGIDLNGDGDFGDTVRLYSPSNTNTYRYGLISSLIWDITDTQRLRFNYTYDRGRHRQTGEFGYLYANGDPENVFGGRFGTQILNANGEVFQKRDRQSIAGLNQISAEWRGDFFEDALTVNVGVRAPFFKRELDQNCYAVRGSTSSTQYCTTQTPTIVQADGFVRFAAGGTQYAPPFEAEVEYEDVLPNVGVSFRPWSGHQFFASYAEGMSDPRTDDLYSGITVAQLPDVKQETTTAYDLGYRFQGDGIMATATVWYNQFENRIERSADPDDPTLMYSRNVGAVDLWGGELQAGWDATESLFLYAAAAYTASELKLTGAEVVDTPDWKYTLRGEYELGPATLGVQGRYVGERFGNDANTVAEIADSYTVVDVDLRIDLGEALGQEGTYLQFNIINALDEEYLGQMSSGTGTGAAFYNIGAPRTAMVSLRAEF